MPSPSSRSRALIIGILCAAGGAGAGAVATATASATHSTPQAAAHHRHAGGRAGRRGKHSLATRAVSGTVIAHTKSGYQPITFERGVVDSVNGDQLTITEGSARHPYKQVTLTVPSSAKVRDNHATSSLSSLTAGQRVSVVQMPARTLVRAHARSQHASH